MTTRLTDFPLHFAAFCLALLIAMLVVPVTTFATRS